MLGDFTLYDAKRKIFDFSFKRVVDDKLFKITHKVEEKGTFDFTKHKLISDDLQNTVEYIQLPKIKVVKWDKKALGSIELDNLKARGILPETIMNESYFLGFHYNKTQQLNTPKNRHFLFSFPTFVEDVLL